MDRFKADNVMKNYTLPVLLVALALLAFGCDKETQESEGAKAVGPAQQQAEPGTDGEHGEHAAEGEDEHHDVHLGNKMYELQRRWSAIWFAGKANDAEMVKYQTHEIEELVEILEESDPQEAGVDVVDRVNMHVTNRLEGIEEAVAAKNQEEFEKQYKAVVDGCNSCHAETKHAFIDVRIPEYNPYPNLKFGSSEAGK
ncbi:hypothetical protein FIV42_07425 [Persicimonas caeni]|uniref:Cytochrome C n=1 Tax=Persicimonas caeni TaxID=2292766 RepID=A0A4Y6PR26_PERCE|nr:hypothetical protein [Persicimonas caeni]QDG50569.1 hypothetical protein FIV42_07425 [Persicimonas caeni]QED31790.1 hypothetical protein FRD00_07420 [Persicimonas caeni]